MAPDEHHHSGQTFENADFRGHVFDGPADFSACVFDGGADFTGCVFKGRVLFTGAAFQSGASFYGAVFEDFVNLRGATVRGDAVFTGAVFEDGPLTRDLAVTGALVLKRTTFRATSHLGHITAGELDLSMADFEQRLRLEVTAGRIRCDRTRFLGGVRILAGTTPGRAVPESAVWPEVHTGVEVELADTEFGGASMVGPRDPDDRPAWPRIMSLAGTDVAQLTVSYTRMSECRLAGAHNLDRLRIEGHNTFDIAPPSFWLTRRFIIRDEHLLRATWGPRSGRRRWPLSGASEVPESSSEVEQVYRALRKGCAEARDEVGAADFYYGEMEMRRYGQFLLARSRFEQRWWRGWAATRGEHLLLWMYWAVSGYGLRAWRAFAALGILFLLAAAALQAWGYPPKTHMGFAGSLRYTMRAAISILRGPEQKLTPAGEWIEILLRLAAPVLFGMAVLALRGRIKR
ncbi:pentapeptide repeat-containing protein [Spirillospora sp. NBC_01491]|uniref:pentapeptide repeat-containing protein n=1 Tax=Spirillospora sp. NBC_01491 TaxID=2976007 RepID=UPI002E31409B|nr:pentapeptide repeat-containing protein [Spirillospora sp. NBC_01491]